MTEKLNVPGLDEDETITLNLLVQQLKEKSRRNLVRASIYDGKRAVKQVGTVIPSQYRKIGLALGWNAKGVDGLARRCNIDEFVWPDGDLGDLGLPELMDSNLLLSELAQARTDSLINGVSYVITTQGLEGEPKALVHARSALDAIGTWNPRKKRLDNLLSITGWHDDKISSFVLYLDGVTISGVRDGGRWSSTRSEHPWHVPADPLVYKPRTARRTGRSRMSRPSIGFQDAALRALIRMEAHMDIYAVPKLIMLGADEKIFRGSDGKVKPGWNFAFGRSFGIPDNEDSEYPQNARADVKQFSPESPAPHLSQLNSLAKLTAREFDLPDEDFALADMANPTSAESYTASRENLIAEAEGATDDWTPFTRRPVARALAIQNGLSEVPKEWSTIAPKWRSPLYISKAAAADAGAKQVSSIPWLADTEVGLELIGLSQQQITRALADKRRAAGRSVLQMIAARQAPQVNAVTE